MSQRAWEPLAPGSERLGPGGSVLPKAGGGRGTVGTGPPARLWLRRGGSRAHPGCTDSGQPWAGALVSGPCALPTLCTRVCPESQQSRCSFLLKKKHISI